MTRGPGPSRETSSKAFARHLTAPCRSLIVNNIDSTLHLSKWTRFWTPPASIEDFSANFSITNIWKCLSWILPEFIENRRLLLLKNIFSRSNQDVRARPDRCILIWFFKFLIFCQNVRAWPYRSVLKQTEVCDWRT